MRPPLLMVLLIPLLLMVNPASAQTMVLTDAQNYAWDIAPGEFGQIKDGTQDGYDEWPRLCITANTTASSTGCATAELYNAAGASHTLELSGRQVVTAPITVNGLQIQRKIYVPAAGASPLGFLRYLEVLTNTGTSAVTRKVRIGAPAVNQGSLGSDTSTAVIGTSKSTTTLEAGLQWFATDDNQNDPAIGHIVAGPSVTNPMTFVSQGTYGNNPDSIVWEYANVTVQPGQTRYLLHFQLMRFQRSDALSAAATLVTLPGYALEGLSVAERGGLLNFVSPPLAEANGPYATSEGGAVTLTAAGSQGINASIAGYAWDCLGDGVYELSSTSPTASCTYLKHGTWTAGLRVTDSAGRVGTDTTQVSVTNVAPSLSSAGASGTLLEGNSLTFSASASDPGTSDVLSYLWTFGDNTTATGASVQKTFSDNGSFTWKVVVSDTGGGSDSRQGTVVIGNASPVISSVILPSSANEGSSIQASAIASDPGSADVLSYNWRWSDGATTTGSSTSRSFSQNGTYTVTLTVADDDGASATASGSITINNVAPVISTLTCPSSAVEGEPITCSALASDAGNDSLTYSWTFGDGTTGSGPSVSKSYGKEGLFTITLSVRDQDGATVSGTRTISIGNGAPSALELAIQGNREEGATLTLTANGVDPGGDALSYAWNLGDGNTASGASIGYSYKDQGSYTVQATATDTGGLSLTTSTTLTIVNVKPTITQLVGNFSGAQGQELAFSASATDPGQDVLTYNWDFGDGSPNARGIDLTNVKKVYKNTGTYTLILTVSDEDGGSTSLTRTINIGNGAPIISSLSGDIGGSEGDTFRFSAAASDPGNDPLVFRWDFGDGSTPQVGSAINVAHVYADDGSYLLKLTVTDSGGLSTTSTLNVQVRNVSPEITALSGNLSLAQGDSATLSASASDPGADTLTFIWDFGDGTPVELGKSVTHRFCRVGTSTVTMTVQDDDGGSISSSLTVQVSNVPPTLTQINGPTRVDEGIEASFTANASELCSQTLTYLWSFGDGTPASASPTASHAWADNGAFAVNLEVFDPNGGSASLSMPIQIDNLAPTLTAYTVPTEAQEGQLITFSASARDVAADGLSYVWNFGDGKSSTGASTQHLYTAPGELTVSLTVTDDDGGKVTRTSSLSISNEVPVILAFDAPDEAGEGTPVSVYVEARDGSGIEPSLYLDWGDGTVDVVASGRTFTHLYADNGSFRLKLEAGDGLVTVSQEQNLRINNLPPEIELLNIPSTGAEASPIEVEVMAIDPAGPADPLLYSYDFGDGAVLAQTSATRVTHTYARAGSFVVTITVEDDDGGQVQASGTINVDVSAPEINKLEGPLDGDEGESLLFSVQASDPTGQALSYRWDFGDGSEVLEGPALTEVSHAYPDNGRFTVRVTVTDEDNLSSVRTREVQISNVAPEIKSLPPLSATAEVPYVYALQVYDPAYSEDVLSYRITSGPASASLGSDGVLRWTPTLEDARTGLLSFQIEVQDDDGAQVSQTWTVAIGFLDADQDGMPDGWEVENGLDPQDPADAPLDPDGDQLSNLEEYENGTDPNTADTPYAPIPVSPVKGAEVSTLTPNLVVKNAEVPNGELIEHQFQIFLEASLSTLVLEGSSRQVFNGQTTFTVPLGLEENGHYYWRARARSTFGYSAWSSPEDFYTNIANDAPGAPGISYPADGSVVSSLNITLEVTNAVDPDRDRLTYIFELFEGDSVEPRVTSLPIKETSGSTRYAVPLTLKEDKRYRWRAYAMDDA
ncbi:MAG: PKD domain-containing protein, partial [Myxococcota bacterium]